VRVIAPRDECELGHGDRCAVGANIKAVRVSPECPAAGSRVAAEALEGRGFVGREAGAVRAPERKMTVVESKRELSLRRKVLLTTALFFGGVGGFLLAGYVVIAILSL
jgi:hypothetical protein